jgi:hypothetical protein
LGIRELLKALFGDDPKREATGNMAVINCTIIFIVCLLNRGLFYKYRDFHRNLFVGPFSEKIIYLIAIFIIIYTVCYYVFEKTQFQRLKRLENSFKIENENDRKLLDDSQELGKQYLLENYSKPRIEMLNTFSYILLIYLSYLELTGTSILIFITQNNSNNVIVFIALIILFVNIAKKIKQFIWRTFTS